jgi:NAD+ kinase
LTEKQLEEELTARGSNYAAVRHHHNIHKVGGEGVEKDDDDRVIFIQALEVAAAECLEEAGLETKIVKRFEYNDEVVKWADMIVTTGGDGTFLMGVSKILNRGKPVIGINTDPTRSEGHLCLPKHYSFNIKVENTWILLVH